MLVKDRLVYGLLCGGIGCLLLLGGPSALRAQVVQGIQAASLNLTQEDGLPSNEVYDILEDRQGNIWIATDGGLARYNGVELKTYANAKKKGGAVDLLREDKHGRIWCKTYTGQILYIENDSMKLFKPLEKLPRPFGFYDTYLLHPETDWVTIMSHDQIHTYNALEREWKTTPFPVNLLQGGVRNLFFLDDGRLTFTTFGARLYAYDFDKDQIDVLYQDVTRDSKYSFVCTLIDNGRGLAILEANDSSLVRYQNNTFDTLGIIPNREQMGTLYKLRSEPDQRIIWVTTSTGIWELNYEQPKAIWRRYFKKYNTSACLQDREGNFWVTTLNQGVFMVPKLGQVGYLRDQEAEPIEQSAFVVRRALDSNYLWLGLADGSILYYNTLREIVEKVYKNEDKQSAALDVVERPYYNQVWVTYNMVVPLSFPELEPMEMLVSMHGFNRLIPYNKDTVIILTASILEGGVLSLGPLTRIPLRKHHPLAVLQQKKNPRAFWASYTDSLFYYSDISAPPQLVYNPEDGSSLRGSAMAETADGTLWMGTDKGQLYAIKEQTKIVSHHVPEGYRLPPLIARSLATDGVSLWMGTDKGLFHYHPPTDQWRYYNKLDGLPSHQIRQMEVVGDYLYASTPKGLVRIHTAYEPRNTVPPLVRLRGVQVGGRDTVPQSFYKLAYHQSNLTFELEGAALRSQGTMMYRYRLLPLDTVWHEVPGNAPNINYTALPAGEYAFEAVAVNEDGLVSEERVEVALKIEKPYWDRWWFWGLLVLSLAGLLSAGVYWRQQFLRRREQAAARIQQQIQSLRLLALQSQMNPHFVFNALSSIEFFILNGQLRDALLYHGKLAKLLRQTFEYSKEPLISLEEEIEFLSLYLELENMRLNDQIDWQLRLSPEVEEESDDLLVPPMLIQPLLENSFKHGLLHCDPAGGHLWVDWVLVGQPSGEEYLHVTIVDNGIGCRQANAQEKDRLPNHQSSGLDLVRQRLRLLAGEETTLPLLRMTDLSEEGSRGTRVEVWIKIASKHQLPTNSIVSS